MIDHSSSFLNPTFDPGLLSRIEDAGINASAPPQERWLDGWLVRFSPGKAKRARCINAVALGRLAVEEKLDLCKPVYEAAALPLYLRITPFSQPYALDAQLAGLGMECQDDTRVMVATALPESPSTPLARGHRLDVQGHHAFAELVGSLRGSTLDERRAHAERLAQSPVPFQGFSLTNDEGVVVACGQVALEAELVGVYDVFTARPFRGLGYARVLCEQMLRFGHERGATVGYLQVEATNHPARHIYRRLGFSDAYAYHYRTPAALAAASAAALSL